MTSRHAILLLISLMLMALLLPFSASATPVQYVNQGFDAYSNYESGHDGWYVPGTAGGDASWSISTVYYVSPAHSAEIHDSRIDGYTLGVPLGQSLHFSVEFYPFQYSSGLASSILVAHASDTSTYLNLEWSNDNHIRTTDATTNDTGITFTFGAWNKIDIITDGNYMKLSINGGAYTANMWNRVIATTGTVDNVFLEAYNGQSARYDDVQISQGITTGWKAAQSYGHDLKQPVAGWKVAQEYGHDLRGNTSAWQTVQYYQHDLHLPVLPTPVKPQDTTTINNVFAIVILLIFLVPALFLGFLIGRLGLAAGFSVMAMFYLISSPDFLTSAIIIWGICAVIVWKGEGAFHG